MAETDTKRRRPPYASARDLDRFFERISMLGDPGVIDSAWVKNYKLTASQPEAIVSVLKWLGVIDEHGKSTGMWNDVRVPASRATKLAELVRNAYSAIFDRVDVSAASLEDLNGTFIQAYDSGDPRRPVTCFLTLCKHAAIPVSVAARKSAQRSPVVKSQAAGSPGVGPATPTKRAGSPPLPADGGATRGSAVQSVAMTIVLNVAIPADWSEQQIRERIAALRRAVEGTANP